MLKTFKYISRKIKSQINLLNYYRNIFKKWKFIYFVTVTYKFLSNISLQYRYISFYLADFTEIFLFQVIF